MLTIVMPAHNEQEYLEAAVTQVVDALRLARAPFEVVVVENGSTDGTASVADRLAAKHAEVRHLALPDADYGAALRRGMLAAQHEWVVVFDVDYVDLGFLERALDRALLSGAAIVVGSKRSPGADDQRSRSRKLITASFSTLLRMGFGLKVSDTHGLKLLHIPPLRALIEASHFGREIFDTEVILRAERAGLHIEELPVTVIDQRPPRSSIARRIPRTVVGLARLRLALSRETTGR